MKSFGNIAKDGQVRAVASGTLTDGKAVIVNSDGTVSVVAGSAASVGTAAPAPWAGYGGLDVAVLPTTSKFVGFAQGDTSDDGGAAVGTVSGTSISFGSRVTISDYFENNTIVGLSSTKCVVLYTDYNDSNKGKAIVGTISGTSISFGSPVVFETGQTNLAKLSHSTRLSDTKLVMVFTDTSDSSKAKAIVGTVSGTSISFGSAATFGTSNSSLYSIVSAFSDTKVIIAWQDTANTRDRAIVGTVSGTSISFGTAVTYASASVRHHSVNTLSDSKFVLAYQDNSNSSYGTAVIGTISGTSITLGTPVVFQAATLSNKPPSVTKLDSTNFVIAFRDTQNSNYGALIQGTVSGTSISYETKVVFTSHTSTENWTTTVNDTVVIGYNKETSPAALQAVTYSPPSTNLTTENFIGFSDGAFATTQSAAINTTNTIDRNQSGLTAGQTYFVQNDGTIGTTAADPSVTAGTAISATELIVKG